MPSFSPPPSEPSTEDPYLVVDPKLLILEAINGTLLEFFSSTTSFFLTKTSCNPGSSSFFSLLARVTGDSASLRRACHPAASVHRDLVFSRALSAGITKAVSTRLLHQLLKNELDFEATLVCCDTEAALTVSSLAERACEAILSGETERFACEAEEAYLDGGECDFGESEPLLPTDYMSPSGAYFVQNHAADITAFSTALLKISMDRVFEGWTSARRSRLDLWARAKAESLSSFLSPPSGLRAAFGLAEREQSSAAEQPKAFLYGGLADMYFCLDPGAVVLEEANAICTQLFANGGGEVLEERLRSVSSRVFEAAAGMVGPAEGSLADALSPESACTLQEMARWLENRSEERNLSPEVLAALSEAVLRKARCYQDLRHRRPAMPQWSSSDCARWASDHGLSQAVVRLLLTLHSYPGTVDVRLFGAHLLSTARRAAECDTLSQVSARFAELLLLDFEGVCASEVLDESDWQHLFVEVAAHSMAAGTTLARRFVAPDEGTALGSSHYASGCDSSAEFNSLTLGEECEADLQQVLGETKEERDERLSRLAEVLLNQESVEEESELEGGALDSARKVQPAESPLDGKAGLNFFPEVSREMSSEVDQSHKNALEKLTQMVAQTKQLLTGAGEQLDYREQYSRDSLNGAVSLDALDRAASGEPAEQARLVELVRSGNSWLQDTLAVPNARLTPRLVLGRGGKGSQPQWAAELVLRDNTELLSIPDLEQQVRHLEKLASASGGEIKNASLSLRASSVSAAEFGTLCEEFAAQSRKVSEQEQLIEELKKQVGELKKEGSMQEIVAAQDNFLKEVSGFQAELLLASSGSETAEKKQPIKHRVSPKQQLKPRVPPIKNMASSTTTAGKTRTDARRASARKREGAARETPREGAQKETNLLSNRKVARPAPSSHTESELPSRNVPSKISSVASKPPSVTSSKSCEEPVSRPAAEQASSKGTSVTTISSNGRGAWARSLSPPSLKVHEVRLKDSFRLQVPGTFCGKNTASGAGLFTSPRTLATSGLKGRPPLARPSKSSSEETTLRRETPEDAMVGSRDSLNASREGLVFSKTVAATESSKTSSTKQFIRAPKARSPLSETASAFLTPDLRKKEEGIDSAAVSTAVGAALGKLDWASIDEAANEEVEKAKEAATRKPLYNISGLGARTRFGGSGAKSQNLLSPMRELRSPMSTRQTPEWRPSTIKCLLSFLLNREPET